MGVLAWSISAEAYLLHAVRHSACLFKTSYLAARVEVELSYRLRRLGMSERVFLGVALAQRSGGVDAHGR